MVHSINLRASGAQRDNKTIDITAKSFESLSDEIVAALRELYLSNRERKNYGGRCFLYIVDDGNGNGLNIGIGLSADDSGLIMWQSKDGFKTVASGYLNYRRFTAGAFAEIAELIINHYGLNDEISAAQTDAMFGYAYDVENEIAIESSAIGESIQNIENYICCDDPEITIDERADWIADELTDIRLSLKLIREALDGCLEKCGRLTGCSIVWDDFCGCDYFEGLLTDWSPSSLWTDLDPDDELYFIVNSLLHYADDDLIFALQGHNIYMAA